MPRDDPKYKALLYIPWLSATSHFAFFVTVTTLMPNAKIFFRHADHAKGLKILLVDKNINWAVENKYF